MIDVIQSRSRTDVRLSPAAPRRRVLHIVESLDRGAVENWLLRMLEHARRKKIDVDWTFYCTGPRQGALDDRTRAAGARVIYSPTPLSSKASFVRALRYVLSRDRYDVLHCHHDLVSAVYLVAAAGLPIHRRIVHVHNEDETVPTPSRLKQTLYREPMRRVCLALADCIAGNSHHTLDTFLAGRPARPGVDCIHYYGVDSTLFTYVSRDRVGLRRELGLHDNARILLFAGRLVPEKNPLFVIDILQELRNLDRRAVAIFAGAGSLADDIRNRARVSGVQDAVRLLGWRSDLPELMSRCDWFVLPHPEYPREGFGLAVVEAQLAGMRLLLSNGVTDDPILPTAVFRRLSLDTHSSDWARAACDLLEENDPSPSDALAALQQSPMDMDRALDGLMALHAMNL